ncbi:plastocyanin/azurin family copper-binding protein [Marimonas sp. MJW-29]|uniref:Plastocyanin/azurin family copper-binding protein n=1 Tax=Sulfitobacter sediminis TaxID=3234186 RepID=A0ABV3RVX8_9RHOB
MKRLLMSAVASIALAAPAFADVIEIEMLNRTDDGRVMAFSQELIVAEVGDIIRFIPTDRGHNAQSVDGAIPEGQEGFKGRINQEVEFEITAPGLTAVVCQPHVSVGMAALIVAGGDTSNAEAVLDARIRGKAGDKIEELVAQAQENS